MLTNSVLSIPDQTYPFFPQSLTAGEGVLYSLYGIVEHSGSMRGGHYTAYVKVRAPQRKTEHHRNLSGQRLCLFRFQKVLLCYVLSSQPIQSVIVQQRPNLQVLPFSADICYNNRFLPVHSAFLITVFTVTNDSALLSAL